MSNPLSHLGSLNIPNREELDRNANAALAMAKDYPVHDDESYQLAADELKAIKARQKLLEEKRTSITGPINAGLKAINDLFKGPMATLAAAESLIKRAMITYSEGVERQRAEARRAEEAAIAQARAAAQPEEAAVAVLEAAAVAQVAPPPPKAAGISKVRETVKAKVVDKAAFVQFIAQSPALLELVDVNETRLNQLAKALGGQLNYPGVELVTEKSLSVRA